MRDRLHRYLLERPSGASSEELLHLVFTQPGTDAEFGRHFLRTLLGGDPRFAHRDGEDRWIARVHEPLGADLAAAEFAVFDLETTGGSVEAGAITEIGAVRLRNGRPDGEFHTLVNPRIPVDPFVVRLTGITDEMLSDQPFIEEVLPAFAEFVGSAVLVAHNASFDVGFLNAAMLRHEKRPLPHLHLCTIRLARRLFPAVRRRSLDALVSHFGIAVRERHRALGDARMTADVFLHLIDAALCRGVTRVDQLLDLQHQARDGRPFACGLPPDVVRSLPSSPGVYRFAGEDGRLLYVGRSVNLRQRVSSYVHNSGSHSNRTLDLIRHINSVETTETGSELEAALLEAEMIRALQPPYNQLSKHLPQIAYLKLSLGSAYPRLTVSNRLGGGKASFYGPFRSRKSAERMRDLLVRVFRVRTCPGKLRPDPCFAPCFSGQVDLCSAPCAARVDAAQYGEQVRGLMRFFEADTAHARAVLTARRERHTAEMRFEAAARAHRDLDEIERFAARLRTLGWVVRRQSFLILHPARAGAGQAYVAIGGRLALRREVRRREDLQSLSEWIRERWHDLTTTPIRPDEVEAATILAGWLRGRRPADGYVFSLRSKDEDPGEWEPALTAILERPDGDAGAEAENENGPGESSAGPVEVREL